MRKFLDSWGEILACLLFAFWVLIITLGALRIRFELNESQNEIEKFKNKFTKNQQEIMRRIEKQILSHRHERHLKDKTIM